MTHAVYSEISGLILWLANGYLAPPWTQMPLNRRLAAKNQFCEHWIIQGWKGLLPLRVKRRFITFTLDRHSLQLNNYRIFSACDPANFEIQTSSLDQAKKKETTLVTMFLFCLRSIRTIFCMIILLSGAAANDKGKHTHTHSCSYTQ